MAERGVLYMVWGHEDKIERALERSIKSLHVIHPELPIEVVRVDATDPFKGLLEKARMFERSPFQQTLFLDADTVVMGRLDFGFEKALQFGIACSIAVCPWARRYHKSANGDIIEYNTGVLFFNQIGKPVFEKWVELSPKVDSSIIFFDAQGRRTTMPYADQCAFALAIDQLNFSPFVLPLNWNFQPQWERSFFGPIKIWHDYGDVPLFFEEMNKYYNRPDSIIQYHAALR
jgi:lipopolysaccharide biosynthesis glycosyltransferase